MSGDPSFPGLDTACRLSKETWLERGQVKIALNGSGRHAIDLVMDDAARSPDRDESRSEGPAKRADRFHLTLRTKTSGVSVEVAAVRLSETQALIHRHIIRTGDLACLQLRYSIRPVNGRPMLVEEREAGAWLLPSGRSLGGQIYRINIFRYLPSRRMTIDRREHLKEVLGATAASSPSSQDRPP